MTRLHRSWHGPATLVVAAALVAGCGEAGGETPLSPGARESARAAWPDVAQNYRAHLSGGSEAPAVGTRAQGQAVFQLSADGTELSYRLIVANIDDVFMSHIHMAPAGANGSIVAWLYPSAPPPQLIEGRTSGVLAEGVVTADDLVGPLAGQELAALVDAIEAGNAYVNVHTTAHPGGEVRGQIR